jgi:hypothetical protein
MAKQEQLATILIKKKKSLNFTIEHVKITWQYIHYVLIYTLKFNFHDKMVWFSPFQSLFA